jgi:hypothetical protein
VGAGCAAGGGFGQLQDSARQSWHAPCPPCAPLGGAKNTNAVECRSSACHSSAGHCCHTLRRHLGHADHACARPNAAPTTCRVAHPPPLAAAGAPTTACGAVGRPSTNELVDKLASRDHNRQLHIAHRHVCASDITSNKNYNPSLPSRGPPTRRRGRLAPVAAASPQHRGQVLRQDVLGVRIGDPHGRQPSLCPSGLCQAAPSRVTHAAWNSGSP